MISALQERYDLSSLDFVGASAGSLAATLAACDADMDLAMTLALELCDANEVGDAKQQSRSGTTRCKLRMKHPTLLGALFSKQGGSPHNVQPAVAVAEHGGRKT